VGPETFLFSKSEQASGLPLYPRLRRPLIKLTYPNELPLPNEPDYVTQRRKYKKALQAAANPAYAPKASAKYYHFLTRQLEIPELHDVQETTPVPTLTATWPPSLVREVNPDNPANPTDLLRQISILVRPGQPMWASRKPFYAPIRSEPAPTELMVKRVLNYRSIVRSKEVPAFVERTTLDHVHDRRIVKACLRYFMPILKKREKPELEDWWASILLDFLYNAPVFSVLDLNEAAGFYNGRDVTEHLDDLYETLLFLRTFPSAYLEKVLKSYL